MEKNDSVETVTMFFGFTILTKIISTVVISLTTYDSISKIGWLVISLFKYYPIGVIIDIFFIVMYISWSQKKKVTGKKSQMLILLSIFQIALGTYIWTKSIALIF